MDGAFMHPRLRGQAAALDKVTAVGYFSLGLILLGMGLYGFLVLLRLISSHYQQFSI